MRNRLSIILLATIISGSLSGYFFGDQSVWGMSYGPGIYFGLTTAAVFAWLYRSPMLKLGLWLGASIVSWYLALQTAMAMIKVPGGEGIIGYISGGLLGSLLLSLFFWFLIRRVNRDRIYLTVATGGILAVVMFLILTGADSEPTASYMISFVIWQVGVGSALTLKT